MQKPYARLLVPVLIGSLCLSGCAPIIVAGAGVGSSAAASNLTLGTQIDDTTIKSRASALVMNQFPALKFNSNVEIAVFNGVVLLLGQVPNFELKAQVAAAISELNGVKIVYDQLQVGPTISFSQYAEDSWITTRVATKFLGNVNPAHFKIITENSIVYLMAVTNHEEGDQAAALASEVPGVKQVVKAYSYIQSPTPARSE